MLTRKMCVSMVLTVFLTLSAVQLSAYAVGSTADTKKVLTFLGDVVGVNVEKYETTLTSCFVRDYTSDASPIGNLGYVETSGIYTLNNWDASRQTYSALEIDFTFANASLESCTLNVLSGLPLYTGPLSSNIGEAAGVFLQRYQTFTGDLQISAMGSMLANVDIARNTTKTTANLKLEVSTTSDSVSLRWTNIQNDVEYSSLNLEFRHGSFYSFYDSRSYYKIGGTDVNISKQQAIEIALKQAKDYSYGYNGKVIDNLTIVEDQIRAELKANVRYAPSEYYPCWIVDLPLNDVYPGSIYYIEVMLWADNGQVISCKEMGYGGPLPEDPSSNPDDSVPDSSSSSTSEDTNLSKINQTSVPSWLIYLAVVAIAISVSFAIIVVTFKKRKNK